VALKNDRGAEQSLGLTGRRKDTFAAWVEQALRFYGNLGRNQSFRDALAEFGLTQAKLDAALAKAQNVLVLNTTQEDEKGEAQQATVTRVQAMDALDDWMHDFKEMAFVALEDQPQLLESLGFGAV
jgi:agmatine/peptidylarginine deiminase